MAGNAGDLWASLNLENSQFIKAMREAADSVASNTEKISEQFSSMGDFISAAGEALAAIGISKGLADFAGKAIEAATAVSKLEAAFIALNGPTEETQQLFEDLSDMELKSNFDFEEIIGPAAKSMLEMGVSADLTKKSIQGLIDTAAALKKTPEFITQVAKTLGIMNDAVIASERHMRSLQKEGVQAWDALAKKIGTDVVEAHRRVEAGLVSSKTVIEAVAEAAATKYGGAAERITHSWKGAMNQIDQATEDVLVAVGEGLIKFLNGLTPALELVVKGLKAFSELIKDIPAPVFNAATAFVALASGLTSIAAAWKILGPAIKGLELGSLLMGWPAIIAAVVAALVLLGSWIHDNWEPIVAVVKQAWDGLAEYWSAIWRGISYALFGWLDEFLKTATGGAVSLSKIWDVVKTVWGGVFQFLKNIIDSFWGSAKSTFEAIVGGVKWIGDAIVKFWSSLPGGEKITTLGDVWDREKQKAKDAADATENLTKKRKAEQEEAAKAKKAEEERLAALNDYALVAKALGIQTQKQLDDRVSAMKENEAALKRLVAAGQGGANAERDLAAARQAVAQAEKDAATGSKNLADARKKSADEAKKQAEEAKKNGEELRKTYETLRNLSPELASKFASAMGGIAENSKTAAETVETVRKRMGDAFAAQVQSAFELAEAYRGLGVTSEATLTNAANKADESFRKIDAAFKAGKASKADYESSLDGLVAAHQKLADYLNKDLKEAFDKQQITAEAYYRFVLDRAIETQAQLIASGTATAEQLIAADEMVKNARENNAKLTRKTVEEQYHELGLKTQAELNKTAEEWKKYADTIAKTSGTGSKAALEAMIKALEAQRAAMSNAQKDTTALDEKIKNLKKQVENMVPAVERLENAFKALGVQSQKSLTEAAGKAAEELQKVRDAMDRGDATSADYYASLAKVREAFQKISDHITTEYREAFEKGQISATQLAEANVGAAEQILAEVIAMSDGSVDALAKIDAALDNLAQAQKRVAKVTKDELAEAFHSVGQKTKPELEKAANEAKRNYELIAKSAGKNSEAALKAWIEYLEILKDEHQNFGTKWTDEDEAQLRRTKKQLEKITKEKRDVWGDFFNDVKKKAQDFSHDVIDALAFGGPSKEHNKQLKEQEAELQASLEERRKEWEQYQTDIAEKQADATKKYEDALLAEDKSLSDSLAKAEKEYEDYAAKVQKNIDGIIEKHRTEADEETEAAREALEKKQEDYDEYASDVAEKLEDIREKYAEQLEDEEKDLRDSLEDRAQDYADFVDDTNKKLSRIGQDTAQNIDDETRDTNRNIEDRKKDYARYAEDTQKKIAQVREKNKGVYSQEEDDLQTSLRRKKEDLDDYIDEQNEKLERYIRDQKQRQEREVADSKETLDRKTRDYDEWTKDTLEKHEDRVSKIKDSENKEVENATEGLRKKKEELDRFAVETEKTYEKIRTDHEKEQNDEIAKQKESLAEKKTDFDTHTADLIAKSDERKASIQKSYEDETLKLQEELGKQKTEYDAFVLDITGPDGKLAKLKAEHKSVWEDIADMGKSALRDIGGEMLHLISDEVLGSVVKGLMGEGGLGGAFSKLGGMLGGLFGGKGGGGLSSGPDISELGMDFVGMVPGLAKGASKGVSSMAGKLFGSASGFNPVMAGISAAGDILNFVGQMRMEGTLNQIERNTAAGSIHLQHILETGVNGWLPYLSIIAGFLWEVFAEAFASLMTTTEEMRDITKTQLPKLDDIRTHTDWTKQFTDMNRQTLYEIRDTINDRVVPYLSTIADNTKNTRGNITVNVSATGVTAETARTVGNQIANNLSSQLVGETLR